MANAEHLAVLKRGTEEWNDWRLGAGEMKPNLRKADLSGRDFSGAALNEADLWKTNFSDTCLVETNFVGANLIDAKFCSANLSEADFWKANLSRAQLTKANLRRAYFPAADLCRTDFSQTDLTEAYLYGAVFWKTILTGSNLRGAKGLTQSQLDAACADPDTPPINLPKDEDGNQLVWRGKACPIE